MRTMVFPDELSVTKLRLGKTLEARPLQKHATQRHVTHLLLPRISIVIPVANS